MRITLSALALLAATTATAVAQDTAAPTADQAEGQTEAQTEGQTEGQAPADGAGLSMGEPVAPDGGGLGTPYVKEEHGDWDIRCIRTPQGNDPCQLYQLLQDGNGNSVAEISVFPLPAGREAAAGATIVTPLETLLPAGITLTVDGGQARRYPFEFCASQGCVARVGFTSAEVAQFKQGANGNMVIRPAAAPDQQIELTISLSGFTAGYEAVQETVPTE